MARIYETAKAVLTAAGLDPEEVDIKGSGAQGSVTKQDALNFIENAEAEADTMEAELVDAAREIAPLKVAWYRHKASKWSAAHRAKISEDQLEAGGFEVLCGRTAPSPDIVKEWRVGNPGDRECSRCEAKLAEAS